MREFAIDFDALVAINGGYFGKFSNGTGTSYRYECKIVKTEQVLAQFAHASSHFMTLYSDFLSTLVYSLAAGNSVLFSNNIGSLSRNGLSYYPTRCALGVVDGAGTFDAYWAYQSPTPGVVWAYNAPSLNNAGSVPQPRPTQDFPSRAEEWRLKAGVGGGPMLVHDGVNVARSSYDAEVMWGSGVPETPAARTGLGVGIPSVLGMTGEQLIFLVVDGESNRIGISLEDMADVFKQLGARVAVNLDGGGSTQLAINKNLVNKPDGGTFERPVAAGVVLRALS